jgi:NADH-dependent peroxiredoxin subunit F
MNNKQIYDLIIIGAGPAGMTAAIFAARREMKILIIGRETGGQMVWANEIENFPGFSSIAGFDLIKNISDQVKNLGVEIRNTEVSEVKSSPDGFIIETTKETLAARTVIMAIGLSPRRLAIPGEEEFLGRGVSYCANCDGPLFKNKIVAVVGGGNSALDAAEVLSKIAAQVYLIHRRKEFRAFDGLVNEVKEKKNIILILNSEVKNIIGEETLKKIIVRDKESLAERAIDLNGLFIEIGRLANIDIVKELVDHNEWDQIVVDEKCRTRTPGLFAAGDVTNIPYKQISIACGQGTIAALAAYEHLQLKEGKSVDQLLDRGKKVK